MEKRVTTFLFAWISLASVAHGNQSLEKVKEVKRAYQRATAKDYRLFAFGPTKSKNLGIDKSGQYLSYGHLWETTTYASIQAQAEGSIFTGSQKGSVIGATLGVNIAPPDSDFAPFGSFRLGYGGSWRDGSEHKSVSGWAGAYSLGIILFRMSHTQLHLGLHHFRLFVDNDHGQPNFTSFALGITF